MEQRPETGGHRLNKLPAEIPLQPAVRGALHAKGGYQVLCISGDLAFTTSISRLCAAHDAHAANVWSIDDLYSLPFWQFHGVVIDEQAWRDLERRGSARLRALLTRRPITVSPREDADHAFKALVTDMAAAYAHAGSQP